jgi:hypothetical protein
MWQRVEWALVGAGSRLDAREAKNRLQHKEHSEEAKKGKR